MQLHNKYNKEELKQKMLENNEARMTLSFYKYVHLENPEKYRDQLYIDFDKLGVFGRIYVAREGVNAQISVPTDNFNSFKEYISGSKELFGIRLNIAIEDDGKSFYKLTIKVREKILADGLNDESFDVTNRGIHLSAKAFNEITEKENTVIIDMRNHYESEVGHFKDAITPDVETFKASLPIIEEMLDEHRDKNIVMYCTGGIRCEKASAYFKHKGFEKVYQLDGGIIEYTRQAEAQELENKFIGKNFVFDERMGERISEEVIAQCHQCGETCDHHHNCANDACHLLFIQCKACAEKYDGCCSEECKEFNQLPGEERKEQKKVRVFNGTNNGKGRFPR